MNKNNLYVCNHVVQGEEVTQDDCVYISIKGCRFKCRLTNKLKDFLIKQGLLVMAKASHKQRQQEYDVFKMLIDIVNGKV